MAKAAYIGVDNVARKIKKCYVGASETYTILDYIESSGSQYIDTGLAEKAGYTAEIGVVPLKASTDQCVLGGRSSGMVLCQISAGNEWYIAYNNNWIGSGSVSLNTSYNVVSVLKSGNQSLSVNGNVLASGANTGSSSASANIHLFCRTGDSGSKETLASIRLYYCKIYDENTLVRDFVPCKNMAGIVGLYDRVGRVFYANSGSGSFVAGNTTGETISVSGVAREIKKAYIGVNGVARMFWSKQKLFLYDNGNEFADVTGGYNATNFYGGSTTYITATKNASNLYFANAKTSGSWRKRGFVTAQKINFSDYDKCFVEYDSTSNIVGGDYTRAAVCVATTTSDTLNTPEISGEIASVSISPYMGSSVVNVSGNVVSFDLSGINESAYLAVFFASGSYSSGKLQVTIKKIWLE